MPSKHDKSIFEIPLDEAVELTKAWAEQGNFIKGYLIDAQELRDMIDEKGVSYVRVYFGWDVEMEKGREQRMIMVPADEYGDDIINTEPNDDDTELKDRPKPIDSNVFDFTMPCPATCASAKSPLVFK